METTMLRRLTRLLVTILVTVLIVTVCASTAEARKRGGGKGKVAGVTRAGQDWYHAKLLVKWRAVRGASYQMRWSYTPSKLSYSKVVRSGTSGGTYTGAVDRGKTWYVQVRAVKSGHVGPWSAARGMRFSNAWPNPPRLSGAGLPGAVRFNWAYTPYASRYRVRWSPAWYGQWPSSAAYVDRTSGGWVGQQARSSTYRIPTHAAPGDNFLAVDYANPVFAQIQANNAYRAGANQLSKWVAAFPVAPRPAAGDAVRMGTYNVMLFPTGSRAAAIASNISTHGLTVVALQEADTATAQAVVSSLGSAWRAASSGSGTGQQILYRNDKFSLVSSGAFNVPNPKGSSPIPTPWARLFTRTPNQGHSQNFFVVSVHFSEDASKTKVQQNRDTGLAAQAAMRGINAANYGNEPVIVAGDMRYGREPYGDPAGYTPAQPTFVRGGYYDSMASLRRINSAYSTVSNRVHQVPHPSGLGPRSDHILIKGARGSFQYVNVVNWSSGGAVPSDHNLIYADLAIPYL
jgi:hypothetical protein